jgi:hypothetical protein
MLGTRRASTYVHVVGQGAADVMALHRIRRDDEHSLRISCRRQFCASAGYPRKVTVLRIQAALVSIILFLRLFEIVFAVLVLLLMDGEEEQTEALLS